MYNCRMKKDTKGKKNKRMDKLMSFNIDGETADTLEEAKFFLQMSKGEIVREALKEYFAKYFPEDVRRKVKDLLKQRKKK